MRLHDMPRSDLAVGGGTGRAASPRVVADTVDAPPADAAFVPRLTRPAHERVVRLATKRTFDVLFSLVALVALLPLLVAVAALVAVSSPGPVLFGHERVGRDGRTFRCWKFRTMVVDAEERLAALLASDRDARAEWEATFKLQRDPRVTRIGAVLRSTSLDELPQFANVLLGQMSVVGPRPIVAAERVRYGDGIACYEAVRPGVTGPWQAFGRSHLTYARRVALDRAYANEFDLLLDIGIVLRTVRSVLGRRGAC